MGEHLGSSKDEEDIEDEDRDVGEGGSKTGGPEGMEE